MQNRAMEYLNEAYGLLGYPGNDDQARLLVRLAVGEVAELLDRLALYDATDYQLEQRQKVRRGAVLVAEAQRMTPARLTESQRTATALEWRRPSALPGNNHKRG